MLLFESFDKLGNLKDRIFNHEHYFIVVDSKKDALEVEKIFFDDLGYKRYLTDYTSNTADSYTYTNYDEVVCVEIMTNQKLISYRQLDKNHLSNEYSYLFYDWKRDNQSIMKANGLKHQPTYQPKKFIYESKEDIFERIERLNNTITGGGAVYVYVNDKKSAIEFRNILENQLNFPFNNYDNNTYFRKTVDEHTYGQDNDILTFRIEPKTEYRNASYRFVSLKKDVIDDPNYDHIIYGYPVNKTFLNKFFGIKTPSYQPKKMVYESITNRRYNEYPYKFFVVKVDSEEELEKLEGKLRDLKPSYRNNFPLGLDSDNFPNYIFIKPNDINENNRFHITYLGSDITEATVYRYIYEDDSVNSNIFSLSDWDEIENIVLYGDKKVPSYEPKKFIYESINDKRIAVRCDDRESCVGFEKFLHDMGWVWDNGDEYLVRGGSWNDLTYVKFNTEKKQFTAIPGVPSVNWDILYSYPKDRSDIITHLKPIPQYKPKKFIYESINDILLESFDRYRNLDNKMEREHCFIMVDSEESAKELYDYITKVWRLKLHSYTDPESERGPEYWSFGPDTQRYYGFEISNDKASPNPKTDDYSYTFKDISKRSLSTLRSDVDGYFYFYETEFDDIIKPILDRKFKHSPTYSPKKFIYESIDVNRLNDIKNNNHGLFIVPENREFAYELKHYLKETVGLEVIHDTIDYIIKKYYFDGDESKLLFFFIMFYENEKPKYFAHSIDVEEFNNSDIKDNTLYYPKDKLTLRKFHGLEPNYEPKKFVYESVKGKDISVKCDNREDCVEFENFLHDKGWTYRGGSKHIIKSNSGLNDILFYKFDDKAKTFSGTRKGTNWDMYNYRRDKSELNKLFNPTPTYKPKKFVYESKENKVLYAFDMDDTLTYSKRFEEHVKPMLLREYLTPEIILHNKLDDIGVGLDKLKYENGRIYFDDPHQNYKVPKGSSWVRKKERIYIIQPNAFLMTDESMPIGTYDEIVDLYNEAEDKCIITARSERLRRQTIKSLENLGIDKPNMGLFMYPNNSFAYTYEYKANKLLELYQTLNYTEVHYYDDNIKILKKIKDNLQGKNINIKYYKVTKNRYREI